MAHEPEPQRPPGARESLPRPLRHRVGLARKRVLLWGFRRTVDLLRVVRLLPQRAPKGSPLHVLIVTLAPHLGDTVMQMPLIAALRAAHPGARIDCAVEESAAPLLRRMPELDHVYALQLGRSLPVGLVPSMRRGLLVAQQYWRHMRSCTPTVCLVPRWGDDLFRSDVVAYLTGARRRIGFSWSVVAGAMPAPYRDAFFTDALSGGGAQHEPVRFCGLACDAGLIPRTALDGLSTRVLASLQRMAATQDWAALAGRLGIAADEPFAVIAPGASHPKKMWPVERWAAVMAELRARGLSVVLLSGASDASVARELHQRSGGWATLVAGRTSLMESLALISRAKLFLGSDSGPGHMAGALGIPTVVLFISTPAASPDDPYSPARNRPLGPYVASCQPSRNLAPCDGACQAETVHCLALIEVGDVLQAADALLEQKQRSDDAQ